MAESKRIFNRGRMNRDIDDRLLPEGEYRDGLNVNVGESEGGDIGAVENLRGNMLISGQDSIIGRAIGSIKDPNNDRVYWFTASDTIDSVYEYDQATDTVTPIVSDDKSRTAPLPTCAPDTRSTITEPDGNPPVRPAFNALPAPPLAYCGNSNANNNGTRSDGSTADTAYDYIDNSLCTFDPSFVCDMSTFTCNQVNDGSGVSQSACQSSCVDPNSGGGGGTPNRAAVTCSPEQAQINSGSVNLTVTVSGWDGEVVLMLTGGATSEELTFSSDGSQTVAAAVETTAATITYSVSFVSAAAGGNFAANEPRSCNVDWFDGTPPPLNNFACDGAGTGSCSRQTGGTFSDQATCEADASCAPAPPMNIAECNNVNFVNNFGTIIISHIVCRNDVCVLSQPTFTGNTSICIQRIASPVCNNTLTTATVGSVTLPLNGIGYVVSSNNGDQTFTDSTVVGSITGSCEP